MRYTEVRDEEETAVEMVWEDERSEDTFCHARAEDLSVDGYDFTVGWCWSCGGEVREEGFGWHWCGS